MVDKKNIKNIYELSPMQEGMLMHSVFGNDSLAYFEQTKYRIRGKLNLDWFQLSWQTIVSRHDIFRTMFVHENVKKPIQIVLKDRPMPIDILDFSQFSPNELKVAIENELIKDKQQSFQLSKEPLMRMKIIKTNIDEYEIIWSSHHILMDGWSLGVVVFEFFEIYKALSRQTRINLPMPTPFSDYIKYLKSIDQNAALSFWKKYLNSYHRQTGLRNIFSTRNISYKADECSFSLNKFDSSQLRKFAELNNITINAIIQSIWATILWTINLSDKKEIDVVYGVTVSGRPADVMGISQMVGLFINTIPQRIQGHEDLNWLTFIKQVQEQSNATQSFHYTSLADVQNHSELKQKLFDHIFVFENYPISADESAGESIGVEIDNFTHFDYTNYDFTFQVAPSESLGFKFLFNANKFDKSYVDWLKEIILFLSNQIIKNPNDSISNTFKQFPKHDKQINDNNNLIKHNLKLSKEKKFVINSHGLIHLQEGVFGEVGYLEESNFVSLNEWGFIENLVLQSFNSSFDYEKLLIDNGLMVANQNINGIAIAASFTVEPIESSLYWWLKEFNIQKKIYFSPYHQIFQQLIQKDSVFNRNTGENIILLRPSDWLREIQNPNEYISVLNDNFNIFTQSIQNRVSYCSLFIYILPYNENSYEKPVNDCIKNIQNQILDFEKKYKGVYIFILNEEFFQYQITDVFDSEQDEIGHIPFTLESFNCLGKLISRKLISYFKPSFKVIVVDCDNTLWHGVVGEVGVDGIIISEPFKRFQEFLHSKYEAGFLLALASKNNEADVYDVFLKNQNMILKWDHFIARKINWQKKSLNLKEIAQELNLGLSSFIFIDDSPVECSEVLENCPEVYVVQYPQDSSKVHAYLMHNWAFDQLKITNEDRSRNEMMKTELARNKAISDSESMSQFLDNLNLKVYVYQLNNGSPNELWDRASQLTFRTNQFNLNTNRRTENELKSLVLKENYFAYLIQVSDRFGKYGWVGLLVLNIENNELLVDTFLLSCRVLGRDVENSILRFVLEIGDQKNCKNITFPFKSSTKNKPILDFLTSHQWASNNSKDDYVYYRMPISNYLKDKLNVFCEIITSWESEFNNEVAIQSTIENTKFTSIIQESIEITFDFEVSKSHQHYSYYQALFTSNANRLNQIVYTDKRMRMITSPISVAINDEQKQLVEIWLDILNINQVGINDHFFELGGHSLLATRLISVLNKKYSVHLTLKDFYDHPTIESLVSFLKSKSKNTNSVQLTPLSNENLYELSYAQKRLWALQQIDEKSFAYNTPNYYLLEGKIDPILFRKSFDQLVSDHESLRTRFVVKDRLPFQRILQDIPEYFFELKLSEEDVFNFLKSESEKPFNLNIDQLFKVYLISISNDKSILFILMHHIISDGWSMEVIEKQIIQHYQCQLLNRDISVLKNRFQYKDYAFCHNQILNTESKRKALQLYWHKVLEGELPVLNLPYDKNRPAIQTHHGRIKQFEFSEQFNNLINSFESNQKCGYFVVFNTILHLLLSRYSRQNDIIIGAPVSGRNIEEFKDTIGFFVNTIALRNVSNSFSTFNTFLQSVNDNFVRSFDHQDYPFDLLIDELNVPRDFSRSPIFTVFMSYQQLGEDNLNLPNLKIRNYEMPIEISRFDLMFHFYQKDNKFSISITYNTDLFFESTITRLFSHFENLGLNCLMFKDKYINSLEMITATEINNLLLIGNFDKYKEEGIKGFSISSYFDKQCQVYKENIAIVDGSINLSYRELQQKVDALAYELRLLQLDEGAVVGCMISKSYQHIICLLAILKAGYIYLPIDVKLPEKRVEYILDNSTCALVISDKNLLINNPNNCRKINFSEFNITNNSSINPFCNPNSSAYIIYTSGSTGLPKGVLVGHEGFVNMSIQQIGTFGVTANDVVLWFASPSFDASLSEIFMTFFSGAKLIIPNNDQISDIVQFENLVIENEISVMTLPPVYLHQINKKTIQRLKILITAGESPILSDVRDLYKHIRYFNAYGPTETSVCATMYHVNNYSNLNKNYVPIGKALPGLAIAILDEGLHFVPKGHFGEICITGLGLALGYWKNEVLTSEKFVYSEKTNLLFYRTGDLGYWDSENQLVFVSRIDEQVKIRGYRIELSEINQTILRLQLAEEVETLVVKNGADSQLACFLVGAKNVSINELRDQLSSFLPIYMIPQYFNFIDQMPLNQNGKIDKALLLKRFNREENISIFKPETKTEKRLVEILKGILHIDIININDSFFNLGGDSIRAIQYVNALREDGFHLQTKSIFTYQSVRQLAIYLDQKTTLRSSEVSRFRGNIDKNSIQCWFFETFKIDKAHFNHSEIFICKNNLQLPMVREVVQLLLNKHEMLNCISEDDNLIIRDCSVDQIVFEDFFQDEDEFLVKLQNAQSSFAFNGKPLWKIIIFSNKNIQKILFCFHHLIIDGVSWRIFLDEFTSNYQKLEKNLPLSKVVITGFSSYIKKLLELSNSKTILSSFHYWHSLYRENCIFPALSSKRNLLKNDKIRAVEVELLESDTRILISECLTQFDCHINELLLTALTRSLSNVRNYPDTLIMMEGHGRNESLFGDLEIENTIGWFTNAYPFLLQDLGGELLELLASVVKQYAEVPDAGNSYGLLRYLSSSSIVDKGKLSYKPEISFNFLGNYDGAIHHPLFLPCDLKNDFSVGINTPLLYSININGMIHQKQIKFYFAYHENEYSYIEVDKIASEFKSNLLSFINLIKSKQ